LAAPNIVSPLLACKKDRQNGGNHEKKEERDTERDREERGKGDGRQREDKRVSPFWMPC